ncbi:MAG: adenosylhomocysteinase [Candidatus Schekmanbacteria bacterium RBG_13_48_7]|uniref:Adenosylhomocysteinase n=1 Tax=Candidatus Schekmanbacteria bacterium RBG_13_48_7 TaxID=1817878 RepID=A0A1F7RXG1_9BACT|nr:MAG: adenosylhomocysteinase [Candidatus Schekmanbacteria bacterium RBG_13_48_7]
MDYHIKDEKLAQKGQLRIQWADEDMPVLKYIRKRFAKEKPLIGAKISACLHVTTETAVLVQTLKTGGADVTLCASNPLSTQDDVTASLVLNDEISVFAIKGEDHKTYYDHIKTTLSKKPSITMDDGADLVSTLHTAEKHLLPNVIGGTEETTTGVIRLRSMAKQGVLNYPIIAVNDANTKHMFDNRYGTGQSTLDGIMRATNFLFAGKVVVVAGYGWCGKGFSMRAKGMGAKVVVTEVDPLRALEATMDGFWVIPMAEAAKIGDLFVTLTGDINVIRNEHFQKMKNGAIVCNSGHFNVELDLEGLANSASKRRKIRDFVEEFTISNNTRINVLADGRLINLAAAEGHPACVMDMSFANQALCVEYLFKNQDSFKNEVYNVPAAIDEEIAKLKLKTMGINIDTLTDEQKNYLASWSHGT